LGVGKMEDERVSKDDTTERTLILGLSDYKPNIEEFTSEVYKNCRKIRGGVYFKIAKKCFKDEVAAHHKQAVFKKDDRKIVFVVWLKLKIVAGEVVESNVEDVLFVNVTKRWYNNMRLANVAEFDETLKAHIEKDWTPEGREDKFIDLASLPPHTPIRGILSKLKFWKKKTYCQRI
jgi:hypothetical protein